MQALEYIFYESTLAKANTKLSTCVGKPGYLGGHVRDSVNNTPVPSPTVLTYWAVDKTPAASMLPLFCRVVVIEDSMKWALGII